MLNSMTGFATARGAEGPFSWVWELRSVNGKGLDLRLRTPDWIEGLEAGLRKSLTAQLSRGNVTCNLRLTREEGEAQLSVNIAQLDTVLAALSAIETRAMDAGVSLAPSKATDIVTMRGVLETSMGDEDSVALGKTLLADFAHVLEDFIAMRRTEGAALHEVLTDQLTQIEDLTLEAKAMADLRKTDMAAALQRNLSRVLDNTDGIEETRVEQELALIAVKTDVTEEIDRLSAHVTAARDLIVQEGAIGRKLDFLMQEFNREANTRLTRIGLALKAVIDQMREQVQNVE